MARGKVLDLSGEQRVERAMTAYLHHNFIQYCLDPGKNGGFDPEAEDCASTWERKGRTVRTSDCVGYALWSYGIDRYQPRRGPVTWLNTTSIYNAAIDREPGFVIHSTAPGRHNVPPGALVVYPRDLKRGRRWGHIGIADGAGRVYHCHGPTLRGFAISKDSIDDFVGGRRAIALDIKL